MLNILTQIEPKIGLKSTKIVKKKTLSLVLQKEPTFKIGADSINYITAVNANIEPRSLVENKLSWEIEGL